MKHLILETFEHNHYWENGKCFKHSHKGGEIPHGHHGCKYGLPEHKPKLVVLDSNHVETMWRSGERMMQDEYPDRGKE